MMLNMVKVKKKNFKHILAFFSKFNILSMITNKMKLKKEQSLNQSTLKYLDSNIVVCAQYAKEATKTERLW